jgi:hypothetical protein
MGVMSPTGLMKMRAGLFCRKKLSRDQSKYVVPDAWTCFGECCIVLRDRRRLTAWTYEEAALWIVQ